MHPSGRIGWASSTTPLVQLLINHSNATLWQNRVGELYSLVQFLRLDPLSFYCCKAKGCECKSRDYRFTDGWRKCVECGHSPLQHYSIFNKTILNPIKKFGYVGEGRKAMLALKTGVFDKELDFYNAIYTQSRAKFDTYVQGGVLLNNYAHIFDLLTRLRQAVDHPYLVTHSARAEAEESSKLSAAHPKARAGAVVGDDVCGLCHDVSIDPVLAGCKGGGGGGGHDVSIDPVLAGCNHFKNKNKN
ncbi:hypothetical protein T492DRAFT_850056 [Pavlovales sp. CCMP2436]|nr:hypothetical protein T492DRAFT_850056 [Pavlovales sp. CCMP2436]